MNMMPFVKLLKSFSSWISVCVCFLMRLRCFRDALSDLALHFLNKMKIMVVKDIERDEIEFICKVRIQCLIT